MIALGLAALFALAAATSIAAIWIAVATHRDDVTTIYHQMMADRPMFERYESDNGVGRGTITIIPQPIRSWTHGSESLQPKPLWAHAA